MILLTVYKATNTINNKSYIGVDSRWPHRKLSHRWESNSNSSYYFHRAIRKYGFESFTWEVLFETTDRETSIDAEAFYIRLFDTFGGKGYNRNTGGGGMTGARHSEQTKHKISESRKKNPTKPWQGRKRSDDTKRKIGEKNSLATKAMWQDPVRREKMLEARKKKNAYV